MSVRQSLLGHSRPCVRKVRKHRSKQRQARLERLESRELLAVFTVTRVADDTNGGSLRWAITQANETPGTDTIQFDLPSSEGRVITPTSALPAITGTVTIDGLSQPGSAGQNPVVVLAGEGLNASGLRISAPGVVVRGLIINGFRNHGIHVTSSNAIIQTNLIGLNPAGDTAVPNEGAGIFVDNAASVLIGGDSPTLRNVISGNGLAGVVLNGPGTTINTISGNYIGVDPTGSSAIANGNGVIVQAGARQNTIGGTLTNRANIISGNTNAGVLLQDTDTRENLIQGNRIGLNPGGTLGIANAGPGVLVSQAIDNIIGGTAPGAGNLIAGNTQQGIRLNGGNGTLIFANRIGTNFAEQNGLGNGLAGVHLIASNDVRIGSTVPDSGNVIAFNGRLQAAAGILIDSSSIRNPILGNSIFSNNGLGIDLNGDGPDFNDPGDGDTGGNNKQNFPTITSASTAAGRTIVQGSLNSTPNTTFLLQFFSNPAPDASGRGEGRQLIGSISVSTNASGQAAFNQTLDEPTIVGHVLSATATTEPTDQGNTSEFSPTVAITAAQIADLSITINKLDEATGLPPDIVLINQPFSYEIKVRNAGPVRATGVTFSQLLPISLSVVSITTTQGSVVTSPGGLTGTLGGIDPQDEVVIVVRVIPTSSGVTTTTVSTSGNQLDPVAADNTASKTLTVINPANLAIQAAPEATPITEGELLIQRVLVTNNGPSTASNVRMTSTIPNGVSFIDAFSGQGSSSIIGNQLTVELGAISFGSTVTIRVFLRPTAPGVYTQQFTASSVDDPDTSDNLASTTAVVLEAADLGVSLSAQPVEVITGTNVVYTAIVTNNGPRNAQNVVLSNTLPNALQLVSVEVDGVPLPGQSSPLAIDLNTIATGESRQVKITATPVATASGIIRNIVSVSSDQGDIVSLNNSDFADVAVNTVDLALSQTAQPNPPLVGEPLTYTVTIRNNGPAAATNVQVRNALPNGVEFVNATLNAGGGSVATEPGAVVATLPNLPAFSDVDLIIVVRPQTAAELVNVASVTAVDQFDTDISNNSASLALVASPADIRLDVATLPGTTIFVGDLVTLNYTVQNLGPAPATDVVFTLPLGANIDFVNSTLSQGGSSVLNGLFTATLGAIGLGGAATLTIVVKPTASGTFNLTASVDGAELDNDLSNNSAAIAFNAVNSPGVLQFSASLFQAREDAGTATITLTRTGGTQGNVSVQFATAGGTAVPGVNYNPVSGIATFLDGQTTTTFAVNLIDDGIATGTLTVGLVLSNPTGSATLGGQSTATLNILNTNVDDIPPTINSLRMQGTGSAIRSLVLSFSEPLDPQSATNPANYALIGPNGANLPIFAPFYDNGLRQVIIDPVSPLPAGAFFRIIVNGSAPGGITDAFGNFLAGNGTTPGTNYVASLARGTNLTFFDADGDRVNLRLNRGGVLDIVRGADGNVSVLRALNFTRQSVLRGSVRRSAQGGNGQTIIGQIDDIPFGTLQSRLTSPPFFVSVQYGNLRPPVQIASLRRLAARGAFPGRSVR